jgi:major membrane immunogen (membrane-anchored lipoprotein)
MNSFNRRSFLKTAGVATGVAAMSASPVAAAIEPGAVETTPTAKVSDEAVIAIVRDASIGEVTVVSGTTEKTYRDRTLVNRLLKAAKSNHRSEGVS